MFFFPFFKHLDRWVEFALCGRPISSVFYQPKKGPGRKQMPLWMQDDSQRVCLHRSRRRDAARHSTLTRASGTAEQPPPGRQRRGKRVLKPRERGARGASPWGRAVTSRLRGLERSRPRGPRRRFRQARLHFCSLPSPAGRPRAGRGRPRGRQLAPRAATRGFR